MNKNPTIDQARDTGMALTLGLLLASLAFNRPGLVSVAVLLLLVTMVVPNLLKPAAVVWFGLAHLLGLVVPRLVLGLVFFLVVTPVGLFRRLAGKDTLQLRGFKRGKESVMHERNHLFTRRDLEKPF